MGNIVALLERLHDLRDSLDPLTDAEIAAFEAKLGSRLPDDYREFLLLRNGGRLAYHDSYGEHGVRGLYGLGAEDGDVDLRWSHETFLGRIPDGWLAIGDDLSGNQLCLSLRKADYGRLFKWDRSEELSQPFDRLVSPLGCTFEGFLRGLEPNEYATELNAAEARKAKGPFRSMILYDLQGLRRFLARGGSPEGRSADGWTPLTRAAAFWPHVIPLLLEHGADIEARNSPGWTPLQCAVRSDSTDAVTILLGHGADLFAPDQYGVTPLIEAFEIYMGTPKRSARLLRRHLEGRGIVVDYERLKQMAEAKLIAEAVRRGDYNRTPEDPVFFDNYEACGRIADSGIVVQCYPHPTRETPPGVWDVSIDKLIGLLPEPWLYVDPDRSAGAGRYELSRDVFSQAGQQVAPQWDGVTLGDIVECVTELYRDIAEMTRGCLTKEQVQAAVSQEAQEGLRRRVVDSLRDVCAPRYVPESQATRRLLKVVPEKALLLTCPAYSRALIEGGGYALTIGPMAKDRVDEPRLDRIVDFSVPLVYPVDESELDGDPRDPVVYARFEICKAMFTSAASQIVVTREDATLAEVADCVHKMHRAVVALSAACTTEDEVIAQIPSKARENIEARLLDELREVCR